MLVVVDMIDSISITIEFKAQFFELKPIAAFFPISDDAEIKSNQTHAATQRCIASLSSGAKGRFS